MDKELTVGMTTYDDYDGVFFTVQALRMYHPEVPFDLIVTDQNPGSGYGALTKKFVDSIGGTYIPQPDAKGGPPQGRNAYFAAAKTEYVLSLDCHVLLERGSLIGLLSWFYANPGTKDLVHGPLIYDDLRTYSTHWNPGWQDQNFGTWVSDSRGAKPESPAFEIPFSGVGVMACRRDAWVGYNPDFIGFGCEEWYVHRKVRKAGGRVWCLPALRWMHRFGRMPHSTYPLQLWKTVYNALLGSIELKDLDDVRYQLKHWAKRYPAELDLALRELSRRNYLSIKTP